MLSKKPLALITAAQIQMGELPMVSLDIIAVNNNIVNQAKKNKQDSFVHLEPCNNFYKPNSVLDDVSIKRTCEHLLERAQSSF